MESWLETVNPATGEVIQRYPTVASSQALNVVEATQVAFQHWRHQSLPHRCQLLRQLAQVLRDRQQRYAELMANEMGKPVKQGLAEIEKCALLCLHYADHAATYLASRSIKTEQQKSYVLYAPLGVVFGIMPWNFPFWQVFRYAVPALLAGNGVLLKHAPISTGTALEIEKLFLDAGFPVDILRTLVISNETAAVVIAHPYVAAVTFTGSVAAGRVIAAEAGKALKKTVLELGGSDAYVVLEDADLELAAEACVSSRLLNAGQSCIAAKRLIVVDAVRAAFTDIIKAKLQRYQLGDPLNDNTTCGPLARKDIRDDVHAKVEASISGGATLLLGGCIPVLSGFFYPPTLLVDVKQNTPAYQEEIFGPVIAIIPAKDEDEAICIANATSFGLGAAVFTKDSVRGEAIAASKLQAGTCVVNLFVASDPRLPFGGVKDSGYGRELSQEGLLSFVNIKTVLVK